MKSIENANARLANGEGGQGQLGLRVYIDALVQDATCDSPLSPIWQLDSSDG